MSKLLSGFLLLSKSVHAEDPLLKGADISDFRLYELKYHLVSGMEVLILILFVN